MRPTWLLSGQVDGSVVRRPELFGTALTELLGMRARYLRVTETAIIMSGKHTLVTHFIDCKILASETLLSVTVTKGQIWCGTESSIYLCNTHSTTEHPPCPSSGSELVVLPSLSPDSSDTSEELPHRISSLASKYSAAESATEGGPWDELLTAEG